MNERQIRAEIHSLNEELGVTSLTHNRREIIAEIKDLEQELKGIETPTAQC